MHGTRRNQGFDKEVEGWFRRNAIPWLTTEAIDPRLWLVFDDTPDAPGPLIGAAAHDVLDELYPNDGRFILYLGVAAACHGQRIGPLLLQEIFYEACAMCSGGILMWRVHPANHDSQKMCARLGFNDWTQPPECKPYMEYVTRLMLPETPPTTTALPTVD